MNSFLLAQSNVPVIGPIIEKIADLLGFVMKEIFELFYGMDIYNLGLTIILFTIIVRVCMIPLFVKQQKFSRISQVMNPEIMEVNNKYKGKRDQDSMAAMQAETKAIYKKYGTSPTGSCLQMGIQMPILWAVYLVIRNIPDYITRLDTTDTAFIEKAYSFLGLDLSISAKSMVLDNGIYFAVLLPIFAAVVQWLSMRLTMARSKKLKAAHSAKKDVNQADPMAQSMKTMNFIMPIFSLWICFTLQAGVALYWAIGSVVQVIIQILVNKHLDNEGMEKLIEKNLAKADKKRKKSKDYVDAGTVASSAQINTKKLNSNDKTKKDINYDIEREKRLNTNYKEGSLASKANLVNKYNEKNK